MSNSQTNEVTKKTLQEALNRTEVSEVYDYQSAVRDRLAKQITDDLLEIAHLSNTPITKMIADEKGIFREIKS